jgi:hypothetical protein
MGNDEQTPDDTAKPMSVSRRGMDLDNNETRQVSRSYLPRSEKLTNCTGDRRTLDRLVHQRAIGSWQHGKGMSSIDLWRPDSARAAGSHADDSASSASGLL